MAFVISRITAVVISIAGVTVAQSGSGRGPEDNHTRHKPSQLFRDEPPPAPPEPQPQRLPRPLARPRGGAKGLHPVPDAAARAQASRLVRELFSLEYSTAESSESAAKSLAAEMLRQADELRDKADADNLAARYVLLEQAVALSAGAGDYPAALAAANLLGKSFEVDAAAMKLDLLSLAVRNPAAGGAEPLVRSFFELADDAVAAGDLAGAGSILSQAEALVRRSKSVALATELQTRRKELRELQLQFRSLAEASETLRTDPDDPRANLTVGQFRCLVAGDWEAGLPMLAKASEPTLRSLASRDLASPPDGDGRAELADAWWSLAEQHNGRARHNLRARAAHWYRQALPEMASLKRALAQKRLDTVASTGRPDGADGTGVVAATRAAQGRAAQAGTLLLKTLATKFPPELRPVPGQPWTPVNANEWFGANVQPGTRLTAIASIAHSGGLQRDPATKRPYVTLVFRLADPVDRDGVRHFLDVQARLDDEQATEAVKLMQGQKGELSGVIKECRVASWAGSKGERLRSLTFVILLDNARFTATADDEIEQPRRLP